MHGQSERGGGGGGERREGNEEKGENQTVTSLGAMRDPTARMPGVIMQIGRVVTQSRHPVPRADLVCTCRAARGRLISVERGETDRQDAHLIGLRAPRPSPPFSLPCLFGGLMNVKCASAINFQSISSQLFFFKLASPRPLALLLSR